jgi:hypothetical protein
MWTQRLLYPLILLINPVIVILQLYRVALDVMAAGERKKDVAVLRLM